MIVCSSTSHGFMVLKLADLVTASLSSPLPGDPDAIQAGYLRGPPFWEKFWRIQQHFMGSEASFYGDIDGYWGADSL